MRGRQGNRLALNHATIHSLLSRREGACYDEPRTCSSYSHLLMRFVLLVLMVLLAFCPSCISLFRFEPGVLVNVVYGFDEATGKCVGGLGTTYWQDSHPGHRGVVDQPWIGLYCSGDPEAIGQQVDLIGAAGFTWVLLTWHGWGDTDLDGRIDSPYFAGIDRAVKEWLEVVHNRGSRLKVALEIEMFTKAGGLPPEDVTVEQKRQILDYLAEQFYVPFAGSMFMWEGRPLLVSDHVPFDDTGDERFTTRSWCGELSVCDWAFSAYYGIDGVEQRISPDGVVWIFPRYDEMNMYVQGHMDIARKSPDSLVRWDPTLEGGLYRQMWRLVSRERPRLKAVVVYAWNVYTEQAAIEPHFGAPYSAEWRLFEETQKALLGRPLTGALVNH